MQTISINGEEYIKASSVQQVAKPLDGLPYVIVRTYSAGVFAGYLESRTGREVVLRNARRLWRWYGAASLSQLAVDGTSDPRNCKFPCEVSKVDLLEVIEILEVTEKAKQSINSVKIWKQ
jgi:hypothetical protein